MTTAVDTRLPLEIIDSKLKELSEVLPFSNYVTRKSFLRQVDRLLDERFELMQENEVADD